MAESLKNIDVQMFLVNNERILIAGYVKYTLNNGFIAIVLRTALKDYDNFCFLVKSCSNLLLLVYLVCQKIAILVLERLPFLGEVWS